MLSERADEMFLNEEKEDDEDGSATERELASCERCR